MFEVVFLICVVIFVSPSPVARNLQEYQTTNANLQYDYKLFFDYDGDLSYTSSLPLWLSSNLGGFISEENSPYHYTDSVLVGDYLYVGFQQGGVKLYDVSNTSKPFFVKNIRSGHVKGIDASEDLLYVVTRVSSYDDEFSVYNITDCENPELTGSLNLGFTASSIMVPDKNVEIAYIIISIRNGSFYQTVLQIIDVSDPYHLIEIKTVEDVSGVGVGSMSFFQDENELILYMINKCGIVEYFNISVIQDDNNNIIFKETLLGTIKIGPSGLFHTRDLQISKDDKNILYFCLTELDSGNEYRLIIFDVLNNVTNLYNQDADKIVCSIEGVSIFHSYSSVFALTGDRYIPEDKLIISNVTSIENPIILREKSISGEDLGIVRLIREPIIRSQEIFFGIFFFRSCFSLIKITNETHHDFEIYSTIYEKRTQIMALDGDREILYLGNSNWRNPQLLTMNISEPDHPVVIHSLSLPSHLEDYTIYSILLDENNEFLYLTYGGKYSFTFIYILDVRDDPNVVSIFELEYEPYCESIVGNHLYCRDSNSWIILDVSNISSIFEEYRSPNIPEVEGSYLWQYAVGNYSYLFFSTSSLMSILIFNTSNKTHPELVNTYEDLSLSNYRGKDYTRKIVYHQGYLYVHDESGVQILDIGSDPTSPEQVGIIGSRYHSSMYVDKEFNQLAVSGKTIRLFDISDPRNYRPVIYVDMDDSFDWDYIVPSDVVSSKGFLFLALKYRGLYVVGTGVIQFTGRPSEDECDSNNHNVSLEVSDESSESPTQINFEIEVVCHGERPKQDDNDDNDDPDQYYGGNDDDDDDSGKDYSDLIIVAISMSTSTILIFCVCVCLCFLLLIVFLCCMGTIGVCLLVFCGGGCGVLGTRFGRKYYTNKFDLDKFDLAMKDQNKAEIRINKSLFEIDYKKLEVVEMIGEGGSNSTVYHCKWTNIDVAFKCFKTTDLFNDQNNYDEFEREVEVLSSIIHPYCLKFYGSTLHPPRVGIVMEFCQNGDLQKYLEKNPEFSCSERIRVLQQSADGFEYLHERNVIHRDVKCENILLADDLSARIIDFGLSRIVQRMNVKKTKSIGTQNYMAPEIVLGEDYNEKVDVFSFSIVIFEVLSGNFDPYGNHGLTNLEYKVANDEWFRPDVFLIKKEIRDEYKEVIEIMRSSWDKNPEGRPSFTEISKCLVEFRKEKENENDEKERKDEE